MFLGQNNHNTKINKRFEGSHERLFTRHFLYLSSKLSKPSRHELSTSCLTSTSSSLEWFLVGENEANKVNDFNKI